VRNKPNLHPRTGIGGASPTLPVGAMAPNEPNFAGRDGAWGTWDEGQSCETNPIPAEPGRWGRSAAPNKAKSHRPDGWGRPSVRNKANLPVATAQRHWWPGLQRNKPNFRPPSCPDAAAAYLPVPLRGCCLMPRAARQRDTNADRKEMCHDNDGCRSRAGAAQHDCQGLAPVPIWWAAFRRAGNKQGAPKFAEVRL
jgi:hypothetical protein